MKVKALLLWKISNAINENGCRLPKTSWDYELIGDDNKLLDSGNPYILFEKVIGYTPDLATANQEIYLHLRPWVIQNYPEVLKCYYPIEFEKIYSTEIEIKI